MKTAHVHFEDGQKWIRITEVDHDDWDIWDEPATDYEEVMDLIRNKHYYRNKRTGEEIPEGT